MPSAPTAAERREAPAPTVLELAAEVHDGLVALIKPATPGSIQASSIMPQRNFALFFICCWALVSFLIFIVPVVSSAAPAFKQLFSKELSDLFAILGAAGLGSCFYGLYSASDYIRTSTFDPRYNQTYLIRFGLGLLSGIILAYFLKDFLAIKTEGSGDGDANAPNLGKISVAALALIGGYAAEGVAQILTRVADTLVALVSGSDRDKIDTAQQKADAGAEKKTMQARNDIAAKLQAALSKPDSTAQLGEVNAVIKEILAGQ